MSFSVRRIDGVDSEGHVTTVTHSLTPDSVTIARGYNAMLEDPDIYKSTDFCGYTSSRHFPEMQLPTPGTQVPPPPTSTSHSFVPDHLISMMQSMHDEQVKFLKPLGRNPCAHYREKDEERILNSLGPDTVLCPFCDWRCHSHQKLMSHC